MDAQVMEARKRLTILRSAYEAAEGEPRLLLAIREQELRVRQAEAMASRRELLAFHGRQIEATISAEAHLCAIALAEGPRPIAPRKASPGEIALVLARREARAEEQRKALEWYVSGAGNAPRFKELQRRFRAAETLVPAYLLIPEDATLRQYRNWTPAVVVGPDLDTWTPEYPECVAETGQLVAAVSQDFSRRALTVEQQERLASLMGPSPSLDTHRA